MRRTKEMMTMTANSTYVLNGVTISEKIIPDDMRWTNANAAKSAGFSFGALYKNGNKLSGGTGKAQWVTIHNTDDLLQTLDDAERYTQATYNQAMGACRPHFYIDETSVWQLLKAGTGLCANDPEGSAEVNWTCGDGVIKDGGNVTSIALEVIMNENPTSDAKAKDNAARIAAWLLWKHSLTIDRLVTHTFWVNKLVGKTFVDVDKQCTNPISGQKWCPYFIFSSTNADTAYKNWKAFKALVKSYLDDLYSEGFCVAVGAFRSRAEAENCVARLKAAGFDGTVRQCELPCESAEAPPVIPETPGKTVAELAAEVIRGLWGAGADRKQRLTAAGYDYSAVQAEVNRILR